MVNHTELHVRSMHHRQFAAEANRLGWMKTESRSTDRQLPNSAKTRGRRDPIGAWLSRAIGYAASWHIAKPLLSSSDSRHP
jgi:hypothetical protein